MRVVHRWRRRRTVSRFDQFVGNSVVVQFKIMDGGRYKYKLWKQKKESKA